MVGGGEVGIEVNNVKTSISMQGAEKASTPIWIPGGEEKYSLKVDKKIKSSKKEINLFINFDKTELQTTSKGGVRFKF